MFKSLRAAPLLLLLWGLPLFAQNECAWTFTATGDATQTAQSNLSGNTPCANWRITYSVTGTLATTVTFQTSPDNSSWTSVPNTVCSSSVQPPCIFQGTNPLTGTTQGMSLFAAYGTYVRVTTSSSSGTGTATIRGYGAKGASASSGNGIGGGGGGSGTVTHTGTLTANALVTGNGGADIKTPSATTTLDASGNLSTPGTGVFGAGGGTSGSITLSGSSTGSAAIQVAAAAGTPNPLQLPIATGGASQCLQTDGGNPQQLTWQTCSSGGGGGGTSIVNTTPVTVSANTAADQTLQELSLTAGFLNTLNQPTLLSGSGIMTIGIAQTPTLTFKLKLCTVSGCGSGTVVTLASIVSAASVAATNNAWNLNLLAATTVTGGSGTLLVHGNLAVDIGALTSTPATVYADTNTTSSSAINLAAALFLDFTVATSVGSGTNSFTQQIAAALPNPSSVTAPGGSNGQLQFNNSGAFGGVGSPIQPNLGTTGATVASLPTSGWTIVNGAILNDFSIGTTAVVVPNNGGALNWRYIKRAITIPYTIYALIEATATSCSTTQTPGIYITDGTKIEGIELILDGTNAVGLHIQTMNSPTSNNATVTGPTTGIVGTTLAVKIQNNSTNRIWSYWSNGAWVSFLSEATGTFLTEVAAGPGGLSFCSAASAILTNNLRYWQVQ